MSPRFQTIGKQHNAITGRGFERVGDESLKARAQKKHLWITISTFMVSEETLRTIGQESLLLDAENLMDISIGCFNCELAFKPQLLGTICKGVPL